jgi:hypothetical protein
MVPSQMSLKKREALALLVAGAESIVIAKQGVAKQTSCCQTSTQIM